MLMRIPSTRYAAIVMFFMMACVLESFAGADEIDTLIEKALEMSGMTAQLEALPTVIVSAIPDENFPTVPKRKESKEKSRKPLDRRIVQQFVNAAVRKHCDSETIKKIVGFYGTSVGRKVGRLQRSALSEQSLQSIREGWKIVATLDPDRLTLIRRLVIANNVRERNAQLLRAAIQGLAQGASPSVTPDLTAKKVAEVGKAIRNLEETTQNTALVAFAYIFRSLRNEELEELVLFQESESGTMFSEAIHRGTRDAVTRIAEDVGESRRRPHKDSKE